MSLSVVIPVFTKDKELEELEIECISTFKGKCDELIVTEDGGLPSPELLQLADTYVYNNNRVGFTGNVNRGWRLAKNDFVAIVNSDLKLITDNLDKLCIPGAVTSPGFHAVLSGNFFVVPRSIKDKYGMLDESMAMWWSDTDYGRRIWHTYVPVPEVETEHIGGSTHKRDPDLINKWYHLDGAAYNKIWEKQGDLFSFLTDEQVVNYNRIERILEKARAERIKKRTHKNDMATRGLSTPDIQ